MSTSKGQGGGTRRSDAVALLQRRLAEIHGGRFAPAARVTTVALILELVMADYKAQGRRLVRQLRSGAGERMAERRVVVRWRLATRAGMGTSSHRARGRGGRVTGGTDTFRAQFGG